jgi:hypothetical protein
MQRFKEALLGNSSDVADERGHRRFPGATIPQSRTLMMAAFVSGISMLLILDYGSWRNRNKCRDIHSYP